jgi:hypothetical protein
MLLSTLFTDTLNLVFALVWKTKFHTHTKEQGKIIVLYILILMVVIEGREDGWMDGWKGRRKGGRMERKRMDGWMEGRK